LRDTGDPGRAGPYRDRARQIFADLRVPAAPVADLPATVPDR
jgi:hypothetical protein